MNIVWNQILSSSKRLGARHDALRLCNLSVIAALASKEQLGGAVKRKSLDGRALRASISQLALAPLPALDSEAKEWDELARGAVTISDYISSTGGPDQWVATFQASDSAQKERGAYATPQPLARSLASLTLRPFIDANKPLRIIDPSAGAGALLIAALEVLAEGAPEGRLREIVHHLNGIELDPASRELCCLLLWIKAAKAKPDLAVISKNILCTNALTRDWTKSQRDYDVVLMNPPWESLRHLIASKGVDARGETAKRLEEQKIVSPDLPPLFSTQGKGDRNLYKAFVELAPHLLRNGGRIGAIIPAAFSSDLGMGRLRSLYFKEFDLQQWTSFENRKKYFPIDSRFKFGLLCGTRSSQGTSTISVRNFAVDAIETNAVHVKVSTEMIAKLGGQAKMIPELRDRDEARVLIRMFENGTPLFQRGIFGDVRYRREVDLTFGKQDGEFIRVTAAKRGDGFTVPLVEGRMVGRYDIFQKSWIGGRGRTAEWEMNPRIPLTRCQPQYVTRPPASREWRIAICDVTSSTNTRTVHAAPVPLNWACGNTAPVLVFSDSKRATAALAVLNSMVFDWMARRIVSGLHLNKFYLETLVLPNLDSGAIDRLSSYANALVRRARPISKWNAGKLEKGVPGAKGIAKIEMKIEREVAMAFHLDGDMLCRIFSADRRDRRGFWRYYAANPELAVEVERYLARESAVATESPRTNGSPSQESGVLA